MLAILAAAAVAAAPGSTVTPSLMAGLPEVPGKVLPVSRVSYTPGGKSARHPHPDPVFVYVLIGSVRSATDEGPVVTYKAGETFYQSAGHTHRVSENASATEPAVLLAVEIVDGKPAAAK